MSEEKIGLMGGSFDPVHLGHLIAAQDAMEAVGLDRVLFIPAARSPLKDRSPVASDKDRLALLERALEGESRFGLSTLEYDRGGISFTIDTVEELRRLLPETRFYWIIGADQAASLKDWHRVDDLVRQLEFIILARPGFVWDSGGMPEGTRFHAVQAHTFSVSSSEVRERIREGRSVRFLLPEGVATLIKNLHLYR
ncbi:MAG: nicotinate-nucleotide adenylyltransferase [Opitutaceae bacterium]